MLSLVFAFVAAFLVALLPGRVLIARLQQAGARQTVSADAPRSHGEKQGTPTMGGLLILFALTVVITAELVFAQPGLHREPWQDWTLLPLLLVTLASGGIGFVDDWLSLTRGRNLGLRAREKLAAQFVVAGAFAAWLLATAQPGVTTSVVILPPAVVNALGIRQIVVDAGWLYYVFAVLLMVGMSNATNLTDGLDGLSAGLAAIAALAVCAIASTLTPDVAAFVAALAGGCCGFLWWNAHPARVFMGDTGSLAIGGGLAAAALLGKLEVAVLVAAAIFWAELLSVTLQVAVFKIRKHARGIEYARANRVFRRTPLHHHFEELGIPETRIVVRFWLAGALAAALALAWSHPG